jgi:HPt (histidine-containing phosphotransfer) domain-containing protein
MRAVTQENLAEYRITVHGLKSISGWICADGIQARAASLEALAKEGNYAGVITLNKNLIAEAEKFTNELREKLDEIDAGK